MLVKKATIYLCSHLLLLLIGYLLANELTKNTHYQEHVWPMRQKRARDRTHFLCHAWKVFCKREGVKETVSTSRINYNKKQITPLRCYFKRICSKEFKPNSNKPLTVKNDMDPCQNVIKSLVLDSTKTNIQIPFLKPNKSSFSRKLTKFYHKKMPMVLARTEIYFPNDNFEKRTLKINNENLLRRTDMAFVNNNRKDSKLLLTGIDNHKNDTVLKNARNFILNISSKSTNREILFVSQTSLKDETLINSLLDGPKVHEPFDKSDDIVKRPRRDLIPKHQSSAFYENDKEHSEVIHDFKEISLFSESPINHPELRNLHATPIPASMFNQMFPEGKNNNPVLQNIHFTNSKPHIFPTHISTQILNPSSIITERNDQLGVSVTEEMDVIMDETKIEFKTSTKHPLTTTSLEEENYTDQSFPPPNNIPSREISNVLPNRNELTTNAVEQKGDRFETKLDINHNDKRLSKDVSDNLDALTEVQFNYKSDSFENTDEDVTLDTETTIQPTETMNTDPFHTLFLSREDHLEPSTKDEKLNDSSKDPGLDVLRLNTEINFGKKILSGNHKETKERSYTDSGPSPSLEDGTTSTSEYTTLNHSVSSTGNNNPKILHTSNTNPTSISNQNTVIKFSKDNVIQNVSYTGPGNFESSLDKNLLTPTTDDFSRDSKAFTEENSVKDVFHAHTLKTDTFDSNYSTDGTIYIETPSNEKGYNFSTMDTAIASSENENSDLIITTGIISENSFSENRKETMQTDLSQIEIGFNYTKIESINKSIPFDVFKNNKNNPTTITDQNWNPQHDTTLVNPIRENMEDYGASTHSTETDPSNVLREIYDLSVGLRSDISIQPIAPNSINVVNTPVNINLAPIKGGISSDTGTLNKIIRDADNDLKSTDVVSNSNVKSTTEPSNSNEYISETDENSFLLISELNSNTLFLASAKSNSVFEEFTDSFQNTDLSRNNVNITTEEDANNLHKIENFTGVSSYSTQSRIDGSKEDFSVTLTDSIISVISEKDFLHDQTKSTFFDTQTKPYLDYLTIASDSKETNTIIPPAMFSSVTEIISSKTENVVTTKAHGYFFDEFYTVGYENNKFSEKHRNKLDVGFEETLIANEKKLSQSQNLVPKYFIRGTEVLTTDSSKMEETPSDTEFATTIFPTQPLNMEVEFRMNTKHSTSTLTSEDSIYADHFSYSPNNVSPSQISDVFFIENKSIINNFEQKGYNLDQKFELDSIDEGNHASVDENVDTSTDFEFEPELSISDSPKFNITLSFDFYRESMLQKEHKYQGLDQKEFVGNQIIHGHNGTTSAGISPTKVIIPENVPSSDSDEITSVDSVIPIKSSKLDFISEIELETSKSDLYPTFPVPINTKMTTINAIRKISDYPFSLSSPQESHPMTEPRSSTHRDDIKLNYPFTSSDRETIDLFSNSENTLSGHPLMPSEFHLMPSEYSTDLNPREKTYYSQEYTQRFQMNSVYNELIEESEHQSTIAATESIILPYHTPLSMFGIISRSTQDGESTITSYKASNSVKGMESSLTLDTERILTTKSILVPSEAELLVKGIKSSSTQDKGTLSKTKSNNLPHKTLSATENTDLFYQKTTWPVQGTKSSLTQDTKTLFSTEATILPYQTILLKKEKQPIPTQDLYTSSEIIPSKATFSVRVSLNLTQDAKIQSATQSIDLSDQLTTWLVKGTESSPSQDTEYLFETETKTLLYQTEVLRNATISNTTQDIKTAPAIGRNNFPYQTFFSEEVIKSSPTRDTETLSAKERNNFSYRTPLLEQVTKYSPTQDAETLSASSNINFPSQLPFSIKEIKSSFTQNTETLSAIEKAKLSGQLTAAKFSPTQRIETLSITEIINLPYPTPFSGKVAGFIPALGIYTFSTEEGVNLPYLTPFSEKATKSRPTQDTETISVTESTNLSDQQTTWLIQGIKYTSTQNIETLSTTERTSLSYPTPSSEKVSVVTAQDTKTFSTTEGINLPYQTPFSEKATKSSPAQITETISATESTNLSEEQTTWLIQGEKSSSTQNTESLSTTERTSIPYPSPFSEKVSVITTQDTKTFSTTEGINLPYQTPFSEKATKSSPAQITETISTTESTNLSDQQTTSLIQGLKYSFTQNIETLSTTERTSIPYPTPFSEKVSVITTQDTKKFSTTEGVNLPYQTPFSEKATKSSPAQITETISATESTNLSEEQTTWLIQGEKSSSTQNTESLSTTERTSMPYPSPFSEKVSVITTQDTKTFSTTEGINLPYQTPFSEKATKSSPAQITETISATESTNLSDQQTTWLIQGLKYSSTQNIETLSTTERTSIPYPTPFSEKVSVITTQDTKTFSTTEGINLPYQTPFSEKVTKSSSAQITETISATESTNLSDQQTTWLIQGLKYSSTQNIETLSTTERTSIPYPTPFSEKVSVITTQDTKRFSTTEGVNLPYQTPFSEKATKSSPTQDTETISATESTNLSEEQTTWLIQGEKSSSTQNIESLSTTERASLPYPTPFSEIVSVITTQDTKTFSTTEGINLPYQTPFSEKATKSSPAQDTETISATESTNLSEEQTTWLIQGEKSSSTQNIESLSTTKRTSIPYPTPFSEKVSVITTQDTITFSTTEGINLPYQTPFSEKATKSSPAQDTENISATESSNLSEEQTTWLIQGEKSSSTQNIESLSTTKRTSMPYPTPFSEIVSVITTQDTKTFSTTEGINLPYQTPFSEKATKSSPAQITETIPATESTNLSAPQTTWLIQGEKSSSTQNIENLTTTERTSIPYPTPFSEKVSVITTQDTKTFSTTEGINLPYQTPFSEKATKSSPAQITESIPATESTNLSDQQTTWLIQVEKYSSTQNIETLSTTELTSLPYPTPFSEKVAGFIPAQDTDAFSTEEGINLPYQTPFSEKATKSRPTQDTETASPTESRIYFYQTTLSDSKVKFNSTLEPTSFIESDLEMRKQSNVLKAQEIEQTSSSIFNDTEQVIATEVLKDISISNSTYDKVSDTLSGVSVSSSSSFSLNQNDYTNDSTDDEQEEVYIIRTEREAELSPEDVQVSDTNNYSDNKVLRTERDLVSLNKDYDGFQSSTEDKVVYQEDESSAQNTFGNNGATAEGENAFLKSPESLTSLVPNQNLKNLDFGLKSDQSENRGTDSYNPDISTKFQFGPNVSVANTSKTDFSNVSPNINTNINRNSKFDIQNTTTEGNAKLGIGNTNIDGNAKVDIHDTNTEGNTEFDIGNSNIDGNVKITIPGNPELIRPDLLRKTDLSLDNAYLGDKGINEESLSDFSNVSPNVNTNIDRNVKLDIPNATTEENSKLGIRNSNIDGNAKVDIHNTNTEGHTEFDIGNSNIDGNVKITIPGNPELIRPDPLRETDFPLDNVELEDKDIKEERLSDNGVTTMSMVSPSDEFSSPVGDIPDENENSDVSLEILITTPKSFSSSYVELESEGRNLYPFSTETIYPIEGTTASSPITTGISLFSISTSEKIPVSKATTYKDHNDANIRPFISSVIETTVVSTGNEYTESNYVFTSSEFSTYSDGSLQRQPKVFQSSTTSTPQSTNSQSTVATTENPVIPFYFTIDANYDEVVGARKEKFEENLTKQLGIAMRVPLTCIQNLQVKKGSIEVNFDLVPNSDHGHLADEKALKAAADELKRMIDNGQLNINDLDGNTLVVIPQDPPTKPPTANEVEHTTLILGVVIGAFILTVIMVAITAIIVKRKSSGDHRLSPIEEARSKQPSYREIPFQEALFMKGNGLNKLMLGKYCYNTGQWLGPGPEPRLFEAPESIVYRPPTDSEIRQTPRPPTSVRERLKHDWEVDWDRMNFSR